MRFGHRRAAGVIGSTLALVCLLAVAQTGPSQALRPLKQSAALLAVPAAPNSGLNRLIIGLRPDRALAAAAGQTSMSTNPADAVRALGRRNKPALGAADAIDIAYHRSISASTHVALTHRRMGRAELSAFAQWLRQDPQVAYVEIDERVSPQLLPDDSDFALRQWSMQTVASGNGAGNFPGAWDIATGAGVVIAQLDGGFRPHSDLFANVLAGYDFVSADPSGAFDTANDGDGRDSDARDPGDWSDQGDCANASSSWHGTHVAGIIAAVGNNNRGVAGAAFNARLLPIRVLGVCGGYVSDIAAGMRWAVGLPVPGIPTNTQVAKVLNMSLGRFGSCSDTFKGAVQEVIAAGSVVVAATGNDSARAILQPANCPGVIAVTAHTVDGDNASYANIGAPTTISAPGGGYGISIVGAGRAIYSTSNSGLTTPGADRFEEKRGTSMATAHVSGVAALMFQAKPSITPAELTSRLVNATRQHPPGSYCDGLYVCGAGLLDASAAVGAVRDDDAPVLTVRTAPVGVALRNNTVQLQGSVAVGRFGLGIQSVSWVQLAGPGVVLSGAGTSTASFVVPATGDSFTFRLSATDVNGKSSHMNLVVAANNTAPVMAPIAHQFVLLNGQVAFSASATDAEGDAITYVAGGLPRGATLDAATGIFNWSNAGPLGNYSVEITASDGLLSGDPQYVGITVYAPGSGGGGAIRASEMAALAACALMLLARVNWQRRNRARKHPADA